MGHQHLGTLPSSRKWQAVIDLISGGANVQAVAAATAVAAEIHLSQASNNMAVRKCVWLLTQIPVAARSDDEFGSELRKLGLAVSDAPTVEEIGSALMQALDAYVANKGQQTDIGEIAQLAAVESLVAVAGREIGDLFGPDATRIKAALRGLGTKNQFSVLARDFFSRLSRRTFDYFLSRELSQHVGVNSRFKTIREHREFEIALDLHCRETSRILEEFAGEWFSKHTYEGGITPLKAGRFAHVAFGKMLDEFRVRRGAHA
jgi:hypothetical protein